MVVVSWSFRDPGSQIILAFFSTQVAVIIGFALDGEHFNMVVGYELGMRNV